MKRIILSTIVTLFAISAFAQIDKQDLAVTRSYFLKDKYDLVKQALNLSDAQGKKFWPIYDQYEAKRVKLSDSRIAIINDYLKQYNTITGQQASSLVNRTMANDRALLDLQKEFYPKFSGAVGGKLAAKFYQVEIYIQEIVHQQVQNNIPFIGELKSKQ